MLYTVLQEAVAGRPAPIASREGLRQGGCGCPVGRSPCWSWLLKYLWVFFFFFSFLLRLSLANAKGKQPFTPMYVGGFLSPSFVGSSVFLCLLKNKMPSALSKIPGFVTLFAFARESLLAQAGLLTYCVATDDLEFQILQLPIQSLRCWVSRSTTPGFLFLCFLLVLGVEAKHGLFCETPHSMLCVSWGDAQCMGVLASHP